MGGETELCFNLIWGITCSSTLGLAKPLFKRDEKNKTAALRSNKTTVERYTKTFFSLFFRQFETFTQQG